MESYLEFLLIILFPMFLAILLNRFVFKNRDGNLKIVSYKLFQLAFIFAIASQINFGSMIDDTPGAMGILQILGYTILALLVFDLFFVYHKKSSSNKIMAVQNIVVWVVGTIFFFSVLNHYKDIHSPDPNNIWRAASWHPIKNTMNLWDYKALPKLPMSGALSPSFSLENTKSLFNLFSGVKNNSRGF